MTTEDDSADLVDLLYDDELDEETAGRLRAQVEDDADEREALEDYESTLETIRSGTDGIDAPDRVHESIMEEARARADDDDETLSLASSPGDPADRPGTPDTAAAEAGLWERLTQGATRGGMAVAATALLAAGLVLYMVRAERAPQPRSSEPSGGEQAAAEKVGAGEAPSEKEKPAKASDDEPAQARMDESDESEQSADEAAAQAEGSKSKESDQILAELGADESADDSEKQQPTVKSTDDEDERQFEALDSSGAGLGEAGAGSGADDSATSTDEGSKGYDGADIDSFGGRGKGGGSDQNEPELDLSGEAPGSTDSKEDETASTSDSITGKTPKDDQQRAKKEATASARETRRKEKSRSDEASEDEGETNGVPSIDDMERAHEGGDWNEVLRRGRALRKTDSVSAKNRPRMLELEADSLEELGQTRRALNQYRKLRKGYPNYKSSRIESAIDRLEKRLEPDEPASGSAAPSSGK